MLEAVISNQLSRAVPAEVQAIAREVAAARPGVVAVLAYGSCLRGVPTTESLIDLYVLTEDLHGVSGSALARVGCRQRSQRGPPRQSSPSSRPGVPHEVKGRR